MCTSGSTDSIDSLVADHIIHDIPPRYQIELLMCRARLASAVVSYVMMTYQVYRPGRTNRERKVKLNSDMTDLAVWLA